MAWFVGDSHEITVCDHTMHLQEPPASPPRMTSSREITGHHTCMINHERAKAGTALRPSRAVLSDERRTLRVERPAGYEVLHRHGIVTGSEVVGAVELVSGGQGVPVQLDAK